jgi:hypothetical protein
MQQVKKVTRFHIEEQVEEYTQLLDKLDINYIIQFIGGPSGWLVVADLEE